MQAKIVSINENSNFQDPQIDVVIHYFDERFPADHHFPDGGARQFIFTLPHEKFSSVSEIDLKEMVRAQGVEFENVLTRETEKIEKAQELKTLEGLEITI